MGNAKYKKPIEKAKVENLFKSFIENLTISYTGNTATDDKNVTSDFIKFQIPKNILLALKIY